MVQHLSAPQLFSHLRTFEQLLGLMARGKTQAAVFHLRLIGGVLAAYGERPYLPEPALSVMYLWAALWLYHGTGIAVPRSPDTPWRSSGPPRS